MGASTIHTAQQLRDSYRRLTERVAAAAVRSGRRASDIVLVAVTKTAGPEQIRQLVEMGHQDFAENRVQHLAQRVAQLQEFLARRKAFGAAAEPPRISPRLNPRTNPRIGPSDSPDPITLPVPRWHMIGHLQRNKAKLVLPLVRLIHSVDSLRLAEELHALGAKGRGEDNATASRPGSEALPIDILIQVNASGEETKFGVTVPAVIHLAEQIDSMIHLRLRGLMTMAPYSDRAEDARPTFARTAELFHEMRFKRIGGAAFNILSMGMSGDFEVAISEGANLVRVGRAIFGEGEPSARETAEALQTRRPNDEEEADEPLPDPGPVLDFTDDDAVEDEGPKTTEARRRARQASDKHARARIARENRSARDTHR